MSIARHWWIALAVLMSACVQVSIVSAQPPVKSSERDKQAIEKAEKAAAGIATTLAVVLVVAVVGFLLAMVPALIAAFRGHPDVVAIFALQLLVGSWCAPVWVVGLVWSLKSFPRNRD